MAELNEVEGRRPGDGESTTGSASSGEGQARSDGADAGQSEADAEGERRRADGEENAAGAVPVAGGGEAQNSDPSSEPPAMNMARLGNIAVAVITVLAALGGLILGIRAEARATRDEGRAARDEARTISDEKEASAHDKSVYARQVDFYQYMSFLTIVNDSSSVMDMRLVLNNPDVWWDLGALRPCRQFEISTGLLKSGMSAKEPRIAKDLTDRDIDRLQLELRDPNGRVWRRDSGGLVAQVRNWDQPPKGLRVVSSEPWNMKPEWSPRCGQGQRSGDSAGGE